MSRIDIVRLRKESGISQKQLADILDIRPSFLSAIENGRSRLPEDKLEKLKTAFDIDTFDDYLIDEHQDKVVPPHTHMHDEGDSLTQLLNHFHNLAHQRLSAGNDKDEDQRERLSNLEKRNDRLSNRLDELREQIDSLREENLKLKELLLKNGIPYEA